MAGGRDRGPVEPPRLHVVTDDAVLGRPDFVERAVDTLRAGGAEVALHVRGPRTGGGVLFELVSRLRDAAEPSGSRLVVNDRVDVALATGVRAVHLGRRSLPAVEARAILGADSVIGISVHDPSELDEGVAAGADWAFVGTVFESRSHPGREPAGLGLVADAAAAAGPMPVLAIGGVTPERVAAALNAGAHGVAVLGGVWRSPDPAAAVSRYLDALGPGARRTPEER